MTHGYIYVTKVDGINTNELGIIVATLYSEMVTHVESASINAKVRS